MDPQIVCELILLGEEKKRNEVYEVSFVLLKSIIFLMLDILIKFFAIEKEELELIEFFDAKKIASSVELVYTCTCKVCCQLEIRI